MAECWSFTLVVTFVFDEAHSYNLADSTAFQLTFLFCWYLHCICTVIFTLLLCWYLHCSNRAPEFLPVWNNRQSVAKTDLFVYSLFYFLLLVSFLACFHSGLPPSLGSFLFSTFKFVCFQVFYRVEICRDRHDRRSCEICSRCVNFPGKQRDFSHNLRRTSRFTHTKCDFALKLLKFYTLS